MKVYIVTRGSYSDYHITKVFLDKERAEKYCELAKDEYESPFIEEWDTDDDSEIKPITYIRAEYEKDNSFRGSNVDIKILTTNTLDSKEEEVRITAFYRWSYDGSKRLYITRVLNGEYDELNLKLKYERVLYDLMAKCESLIHVEGWTDKMVEEWLSQNIDEYLK